MESEEYTEVSTESWFSRLGNSIIGVILGIVLFIASFFLLFWNEGRIDLSNVAKNAIAIELNNPKPSATGKLVSVTGNLITSESLGDNLFLNSDQYLAFWREVEMFAWEETTITETEKNVGGSKTKETTYRYSKAWQESPDNSSSFHIPQGHHNPELPISDEFQKAPKMKIGSYHLRSQELTLPKPSQPLQLTENTINLNNQASQHGNYIFQGEGTFTNPEVGDIRLQYYVLPSKTKMTIFGKLKTSNNIVSYQTKQGTTFYRGFLGTRESAIAQLKNRHIFSTWLLRGVGFLMMWLGLNLAFSPIAVILDFFPFVGDLFRSLSGIATFFVTFLLSSVTIIVSILLHNLVALIVAVIVALTIIASGRYVLRLFASDE